MKLGYGRTRRFGDNNSLPQPVFFVDVSEPPAREVSAGLAVRRLIDLGAERAQHRTEAALAADQGEHGVHIGRLGQGGGVVQPPPIVVQYERSVLKEEARSIGPVCSVLA